MNGQRALAVVVLVASLFVIGTMSASLGATVTSTPDDVIDVDTDELPFMGDGASEIANSYQKSDKGTPDREFRSEGEGTPADESSGDPPENREQNDGGQSSENQAPPPSGAPPKDGNPPDGERSGGGEKGGESGGGGQGGTSGQGQAGGQQPGQGAGDPAQSLWTFLRPLLLALLSLLAAVILVAAGYLLYRRRDRLLARLRALADRYGLTSSGRTAVAAAAGDDVDDPATVVERAWGEMLRKSGARPPRSDTPRECAGAVVAAGAAREPVDELTALYERVRYGGRPVTPDEASRALVRLREVVPDGGDVVAEEAGTEGPGRGAGRPTTVSDGGAVTDREGGGS